MINLIHLCSTKRYQTTTGMVKAYVAQLSDVRCFIMPLDEAASSQNGYEFGQAFDLYCELGTDIKTSDEVEYAGDTYHVKGVAAYDVPIVGHIKCRIVRGGQR